MARDSESLRREPRLRAEAINNTMASVSSSKDNFFEMAKLILSPFPPFKLNRPRIPPAGKNCFTAFTRGRPRVPFFIRHQEAVKPLETMYVISHLLSPKNHPFSMQQFRTIVRVHPWHRQDL